MKAKSFQLALIAFIPEIFAISISAHKARHSKRALYNVLLEGGYQCNLESSI
jgi:hypothetical protein